MPYSTEDVQTQNLGPRGPKPPTQPLRLIDELPGILSPGREGTLGRLGHYDVLEVLGRGGFGIVVKALDETLQRLVAIKILSPQLATTSPPRKFFLREARSAAKIRHENVVQIHSVDEAPSPYLVMEYIEGETLHDRLDRTGPLDVEEAVQLGRQIALGLAAAHATGLIHRDIKPANILLEKGDPPRVKITDFGIARTADDASITQSGVIVGTPMYMSPEQAGGEPVDHRADLFSLGSVLYTMVSGHPPFRSPTTMGVLKRVIEDVPRSIREVNPTVSLGLCAVIKRLHSKSPKDRYASAFEVATALDLCLTENQAVPRRRKSALLYASVLAASLLVAVFVRINSGLFADPAANPSNKNQPTEAAAPAPVVQAVVKPEAEKAQQPTDAWENLVAAMPVGDQVPAVNAKLRVLNPGYADSGLTYKIKGDVVDSLTIVTSSLSNLSPLRALKNLRELHIIPELFDGRLVISSLADLEPLRGMQLEVLSIQNSSVANLGPLTGMPLKKLDIWDFRGHDLTPLKGMPLTILNCGCSKVRDLSPLRGLPLTFLCLNISEVSDLAPLVGMKLTELLVENTKVTDLTPVLKMPLETLAVRGSSVANLHSSVKNFQLKSLFIDFDPARDSELIRSIPTLEKINHQPIAEFMASAGK